MRSPLDVSALWLATPCVGLGVYPPADAAETFLGVVGTPPTDGLDDELSQAASKLATACPDLETAVAHLLTLRGLVPGRDRLAIDRINLAILQLVSEELAEARRHAHLDPLTELGNRRALDIALPTAIARAQRTGRGLSVVYFDLVGLKGLNDRFGHETGDAALRTFAKVLVTSARSSDSAYRVGGDEFVALMPDTEAHDPAALADRIVRLGAPPFSWGAANTDEDGHDGHRLIRLADVRMLGSRYGQARERAARDRTSPPEDEVDLRDETAVDEAHR